MTIFCFALVTILLGLSYSPAFWLKRERKLLLGNCPEPEILANMYKLLIEENTSMTATVKPNFGKTSFYEALKGDIDIYPEFTGTVTEKSTSTITESGPRARAGFIRWRVGRHCQNSDHLAYLKTHVYQNTQR